MAIALDDLRSYCGGFQSEARADFFFEFWREVGEDSDRAGEFSDAHVFGGGHEARDIALRLRIPVGEFESEGDGLGVDAVRASDHGRVFELPRAALENFGETLKILRDDLRGLADEQGLRGVDDVIGGESVVKPAGVRANDFGDRGGEGDDVVADLGLDFVDALDAEVRALFDRAGRRPWGRGRLRRGFRWRRLRRRARCGSGFRRSRCGPSRVGCSAGSRWAPI